MSPEEFYKTMLAIYEREDSYQEPDHRDADMLMLQALSELGYGKGCDIYTLISKWYC